MRNDECETILLLSRHKICTESEQAAWKLLMKVGQFWHSSRGSPLPLDSLRLYIQTFLCEVLCSLSQSLSVQFSLTCSFLLFTLSRPLKGNEEEEEMCVRFDFTCTCLSHHFEILRRSLSPLQVHIDTCTITAKCNPRRNTYKNTVFNLLKPVHQERRPGSAW